jgi:hypothetical protein
MRIDAAIVCQGIAQRDGLCDLTGVGIDMFFADSFPAEGTLPLYVRVVGAADASEHHLLLRITDANGDTQCEVMQPITLAPPANQSASGETRGHHVVGLNFSVAEPGTYDLLVSVDSGDAISQPLHWVQN